MKSAHPDWMPPQLEQAVRIRTGESGAEAV